jgi:hypothetical protein
MTATDGASASEIAKAGAGPFATIAKASPARVAMLVHMRKSLDDETTEALTADVAEGWHD